MLVRGDVVAIPMEEQQHKGQEMTAASQSASASLTRNLACIVFGKGTLQRRSHGSCKS